MENIQGQQKFLKGSPVFLDRMFQNKFVFHFLKAIFDTSFRLAQPFFTLIFYHILSTNSSKKCIEISLESLQVDNNNNNNNLILILRAFHEMIKRALHDFYL